MTNEKDCWHMNILHTKTSLCIQSCSLYDVPVNHYNLLLVNNKIKLIFFKIIYIIYSGHQYKVINSIPGLNYGILLLILIPKAQNYLSVLVTYKEGSLRWYRTPVDIYMEKILSLF